MVKRVALAVLGLLAVVLLARRNPDFDSVDTRRIALGTLVRVKLFQSGHKAEALVDTAFAEIARTDSLMSRHIGSSEVNWLTDAAVDSAVTCSPDMARVLSRCLHYARVSGGRFDVTLGALTRLWDFREAASPPCQARIDSALHYVGYQYLELEGRTVRLRRPGVQLDLGAAAKGYAVDRAALRLQNLGVESGLIEAGGDIRYWGEKPDGSAWSFGIQHPRNPGRYARAEDIGLPAIATSGDYERFFMYDGRRYHHILDPGTGFPAMGTVSATVWARSALEADVLSTAVFILGPGAGLDLAAGLQDVEALVYYEEGGRLRHTATDGLTGHLNFSDAEN